MDSAVSFSIVLSILDCVEQVLADVFEEKRPKDIFPDDYNKYKPPIHKGEPAHVYVSVNLMDVDTIDEGRMEFSIQMYLMEFWFDYRLNLSSYQLGHTEPPIFPKYLAAFLWVPDLVFDNTKDGKMFHLSLPNTAIKVLSDGSFYKTSRYNLIVSCAMDFHLYPMDTQKCFLKIATLSNADSKVLLHWLEESPFHPNRKSIHLLYQINPLKYQLQQIRAYKEQEVWPDGNYTFLYANFTFTRRISAAIFNVYIPSTLVVLLSWISFWVDVEAVPARITLGVTSLLTLATQMVQAHSGLPAISYMTAMDIYLFVCLLTVFGVLLEFAFAYQVFIKSKQRVRQEERSASDVGFKKTEIRVLRFGRDLKVRSPVHKSSYSPENISNPKAPAEKYRQNKYLDRLCRKVFPLLFTLFSFIYWIYYLHH